MSEGDATPGHGFLPKNSTASLPRSEHGAYAVLIYLEDAMFSRILNWIGPVSLALAAAYTVWSFNTLPPQIPLHFGLTGRPDNWSGKALIFLFPILGAALWLGLTFVKRFPHTFNYPTAITPNNREQQQKLALKLIDWVRCETAVLFAFIPYQQIAVASGKQSALDMAALIAIVVWINLTIAVYLVLALRRTSP
jgi:uncharacterized membrane protein